MKTLRCFFSIFAMMTLSSLFAASDAWLGHTCSVEASFSVRHEQFINPPKIKILSLPSYPIELLDALVQGHATIQFVVDQDGTIKDVSVVSADSEAFGKEAKKAIEATTFLPGKNSREGTTVAVKMQCSFDFKLCEKKYPPESK